MRAPPGSDAGVATMYARRAATVASSSTMQASAVARRRGTAGAVVASRRYGRDDATRGHPERVPAGGAEENCTHRCDGDERSAVSAASAGDRLLPDGEGVDRPSATLPVRAPTSGGEAAASLAGRQREAEGGRRRRRWRRWWQRRWWRRWWQRRRGRRRGSRRRGDGSGGGRRRAGLFARRPQRLCYLLHLSLVGQWQ